MGESGSGKALGDAREHAAAVLVAVLLALAVAGCTSHRWSSAGTADETVTLAVANDGAEVLRCTILFGHWVEQGAGTVAPGDVLAVEFRRQESDGALYVPRYDGRKMMVENLICGPLEQWWERRADIPLLPLRAGTAQRFQASCRIMDRATCTLPAAVKS
jgi:hypothetical protein